jgi:hypothetical protein
MLLVNIVVALLINKTADFDSPLLLLLLPTGIDFFFF